MHNAASTAISFGLLISIVGASFVYVNTNAGPIEIPREPWLGISGSDITPAIAERLGLSEPRGILIFTVTPGSPADKAGLRGGDRAEVIEGEQVVLGGDVIVGADGREIRGAADLRAILDQKNVGDTMRFTIIRGSSTQEISVVLEERPSG